MDININLLLATLLLYFQHTCAEKLFRGECCQEYCYSTDKERPQNKHFSSDSAYQLIKGSEYAQQSVIPNCKPVRFWLLSRHGTRLPEDSEIESLPELVTLRDQIIENYEVKKTAPAKGALCDQDFQLIKNWVLNPNITVDKAEFLTIQGWNDLKILAQDYKRVLPELLGREYDASKFLFRHTSVQRTIASLKGFIEGLFGDGAYNGVTIAESPQNNTLLIPMKYCPAWREDIGKVNDPDTEVDKYIKSALVTRMLADVSMRLGFEKPLTFRQVQLIYNICAYETAWFLDKPSPWCTALTLDQAKIVEFENDLFYQYRSGYGNTLNSNVPCEVIKDMLTRLNSDEEPRVTAYFSHSSLIQMIGTGLGLFKDNSLLSHSNYEAMEKRKWRSSFMDPFASNYAVVKYDCSEDKMDNSPKVKFFLNQRPLEIDGCPNGLCKLTDLMEKYEKFAKADCMSLFCTRASSGSLASGSLALVLKALVYNWFK